jgi:hypothetical protein
MPEDRFQQHRFANRVQVPVCFVRFRNLGIMRMYASIALVYI